MSQSCHGVTLIQINVLKKQTTIHMEELLLNYLRTNCEDLRCGHIHYTSTQLIFAPTHIRFNWWTFNFSMQSSANCGVAGNGEVITLMCASPCFHYRLFTICWVRGSFVGQKANVTTFLGESFVRYRATGCAKCGILHILQVLYKMFKW